MKYTPFTFCLILLTSFQNGNESAILSNKLRQEIIGNSTLFKPTEITINKIDKKLKGKRFKESVELFSILNKRKMFEADSSLVLGHFITKDNSIAIICYDKTYECDHPIDSYSVYVADKNGKLSDQLIINYRDNDITIYEINFKFLSDSVIEISEKTSSEYSIELKSKTDTIVTTIYKIAYLKNPFDTISKTQNQKIIQL